MVWKWLRNAAIVAVLTMTGCNGGPPKSAHPEMPIDVSLIARLN